MRPSDGVEPVAMFASGATYRGRFAPSPTGALHAGSLAAALASWLDARAHGGRWLVRLEDIDGPRCLPGADAVILSQLAAFGLVSDEPPVRQSERGAAYRAALVRLQSSGWVYRCGCTRSDIARAWAERGIARERHGELVYPGTCRHGPVRPPPHALRVVAARDPGPAYAPLVVAWYDRRLGPQRQDVSRMVGDFVLRRADGSWTYQLAVVVDDAEQGITHVVRGEDLADNSARQMHLQRLLAVGTPRYLHTPLVVGADGQKLSKQNGARPVPSAQPLAALNQAAEVLGLHPRGTQLSVWLASATAQWHDRWVRMHVS